MPELAAPTTTVVTEPGVYDDMPNDVYHADPVPGGSLSCSGAKKLLPPGCPARFKYERDNPPEPKPHFDLGHAAHKLVLGAGADIEVIEADSFRTKAAKQQRDEAHADGRIPLLADDYEQVEAMAAALRAHPIAKHLFNPDAGKPEQSLFWIDERSGIWRRARLDWLPNRTEGRLLVPDYKTARTADPQQLPRDAHNFGYHQQAAWYLDGIEALGLADEAVFLFVFQEKDPPYLVTVAEFDPTAIKIGRHLNRMAIAIYRDCVESDEWPGYLQDVHLLSLPAWAENRYLEEAL